MSYTSLNPYLLPGYPREREDDRSVGNVYVYRIPAATYATDKPLINETWADGRPVKSLEADKVSLSGYVELTLNTADAFVPGDTISTVQEGDPRYELRWVLNDLPLMQHPAFLPEGASDLGAAASGSPTRTHRADVIGWENEIDQALRSQRKYKLRDSNGNAYGSEITLTDAALAYAKLRELGFESYTVHTPLWVRVTRYRGTETPGVGTIGQYVEAASVPELPSDIVSADWQFIKAQDDAVRAGVSITWERTEAWQGFKKVYYDVDTINPASNTLP